MCYQGLSITFEKNMQKIIVSCAQGSTTALVDSCAGMSLINFIRHSVEVNAASIFPLMDDCFYKHLQ